MGVNHSIQQSLMEESLRGKRRRRERRCASTGLEHRCLHDSAGAECSQTLYSYNRLSTKSVLNNEKVNYIRSNPVTNSKEFRRQYPRHERRCASTVLEYRRLHDPAGAEYGETLYGDGSYEASERKKNMEYL